MPSYNSSDFIADAINSILSQTYSNWELLITDDGSIDETIEIVRNFEQQDARIKLFCLQKNIGAGAARNNSIEKAKGRFIAFCDSDDCWYPSKLEKQLSFMITKNCALSYTSYMLCDESNRVNGIVVCNKRETYFTMKCNNRIGCLSAMYDKNKVGIVYMPNMRKRQDWGLWLKILSKCNVAYGIKEPLAVYRIRAHSLSYNKISLIEYNLAVYRNVLGCSVLKSYCYFFFLFLPSYLIRGLFMHYINR